MTIDKTLVDILRESYDLQEKEPDHGAYWHLEKLRTSIKDAQIKLELKSSTVDVKELPSDEEIEKQSDAATGKSKYPNSNTTAVSYVSYKDGAKWMRDKLKAMGNGGGEKEYPKCNCYCDQWLETNDKGEIYCSCGRLV